MHACIASRLKPSTSLIVVEEVESVDHMVATVVALLKQPDHREDKIRTLSIAGHGEPAVQFVGASGSALTPAAASFAALHDLAEHWAEGGTLRLLGCHTGSDRSSRTHDDGLVLLWAIAHKLEIRVSGTLISTSPGHYDKAGFWMDAGARNNSQAPLVTVTPRPEQAPRIHWNRPRDAIVTESVCRGPRAMPPHSSTFLSLQASTVQADELRRCFGEKPVSFEMCSQSLVQALVEAQDRPPMHLTMSKTGLIIDEQLFLRTNAKAAGDLLAQLGG